MAFTSTFTVFITFLITISTFTNAFPFVEQIPTGSVGVYFKYAEMQYHLYNAGFHTNMHPFGHFEYADIRPQMDQIPNVECATKDKTMLYFKYIDVYNQLSADNVLNIFEKYTKDYDNFLIKEPIRQRVREMCNEMTVHEVNNDRFSEFNDNLRSYLIEYQNSLNTNLIINKISVPKPILPEKIRKNNERIVESETERRAITTEQQTMLKRKENERLEEEAEASKQRSLAQIKNMQKIDAQENEAKLARIRAESDAKQKEIYSEAEAKSIKILAEAMEVQLTPEYLNLKYIETLNKTKMYWGNQLPEYAPAALFN